MSDAERRVIAYHEAGHCLAAELCPTHAKASRITILARGQALGLALYGQTDQLLLSPQHLHERMVVGMAGRAAEQLTFGQVTSGAANDLEQANSIARHAVETLGFSPRVGQILVRQRGAEMGLAEATRRSIDEEVVRLVDEAYRDALDLLAAHRPQLVALAEALLAREQLERAQIERVTALPSAPRQPADHQVLPTDRPPVAEPVPVLLPAPSAPRPEWAPDEEPEPVPARRGRLRRLPATVTAAAGSVRIRRPRARRPQVTFVTDAVGAFRDIRAARRGRRLAG
jgi:cell division protease FtsH